MEFFKLPGTNSNLSRFIVGTVQLGKTYGIDTLGKPTREKSIKILEYAVKNGINVFDTAPDYGDSEKIIGYFLRKFGRENKFISTKLEKLPEEAWKNKDILSYKIRKEFDLSCKRLGVDKINIYLIHFTSEAFRDKGKVLDILDDIKAEGRIDLVGVSIYTEEEFRKCMEDERIGAVQLPFNALDRRLTKSGLLAEAKKRNLVMFARSIYLQGLLLMEPERIPSFLSEAISFIKELRKIARFSGHSIKELCIKYALSINSISFIVVGINSLDQLKENINIFNSKPLDKEVIKAINEIPIPSNYILNPGKWKSL
jgi:aryl-alcohol dehydrogenase-like predicted oxidoreductase